MNPKSRKTQVQGLGYIPLLSSLPAICRGLQWVVGAVDMGSFAGMITGRFQGTGLIIYLQDPHGLGR